MIKIGLAPFRLTFAYSRRSKSSQSPTRPPILLPWLRGCWREVDRHGTICQCHTGAGRHTWTVRRYTPSHVKDDAHRICLVKRVRIRRKRRTCINNTRLPSPSVTTFTVARIAYHAVYTYCMRRQTCDM